MDCEKRCGVEPNAWFVSTRLLLVASIGYEQQRILELLTLAGIEVDIAEDGQDAVMLLKKGNTYDLILVDLQLPLRNEENSCLEIREFDPDTPIIVLTAASDDFVVQAGPGSRINRYLSKPVKPSNLIEAIKTILNAQLP